VILDAKGNIFGGFTPVEWESRPVKRHGRLFDDDDDDDSPPSNSKADPSLKSFLFTLKNPHNVPARRFALKAERKDEAIHCCDNSGPNFSDIEVASNCSTNAYSFTYGFGRVYTNDTGLDGKTFFTGTQYFHVNEIEVFEITE
jgi:hypothetical protein